MITKLFVHCENAPSDAPQFLRQVAAIDGFIALISGPQRWWTPTWTGFVGLDELTPKLLYQGAWRKRPARGGAEPDVLMKLAEAPSSTAIVGSVSAALGEAGQYGLKVFVELNRASVSMGRVVVDHAIERLAASEVRLTIGDTLWHYCSSTREPGYSPYRQGFLKGDPPLVSEPRAEPSPTSRVAHADVTLRDQVSNAGALANAEAQHAATEEVDMGEIRRRLGQELPPGFAGKPADENAGPEGPRTVRTAPSAGTAAEGVRRTPFSHAGPTLLLLNQPSDEGGTVLAPVTKELLASHATHFGQRLTPVRVPDLPVEQYAELVATLQTNGLNHAPTLQRFGIFSVEARRALDELFQERFATHPDDRARFEAWLAHHQERMRRDPTR